MILEFIIFMTSSTLIVLTGIVVLTVIVGESTNFLTKKFSRFFE